MCLQIDRHIKRIGLNQDLLASTLGIFREQWNLLHTPLHAAAYVLEPQFKSAALGRGVCISLWDASLGTNSLSCYIDLLESVPSRL